MSVEDLEVDFGSFVETGNVDQNLLTFKRAPEFCAEDLTQFNLLLAALVVVPAFLVHLLFFLGVAARAHGEPRASRPWPSIRSRDDHCCRSPT